MTDQSKRVQCNQLCMIDWKDEKMQDLSHKYGDKELEKHGDPFERLLISIINQQLSVESAKAIRKRFFDKFDTTPQAILEADEDDINETGVSGQKIDYMKSAATYFIEDDLTVEKFSEMSDEEVIEELTQIHGIGDWTAKIFLMFALGREDVFPVEDLGIRKSMEQIYGMNPKGTWWRSPRNGDRTGVSPRFICGLTEIKADSRVFHLRRDWLQFV